MSHWEESAKIHKDSHWASWGDELMINLEIDLISKYIKDGDKVLDVGCANGYPAFKQLERKKISIVGVDYSPEMVKQAIIKKSVSYFQSLVSFQEGDVRGLSLGSDLFDVTYTTRTLINVLTWEEQMDGIRECLRVTKPGGLVIFSEAFWEPLQKLNAIRQLCGLDTLVEHDFNKYLKKERFEEFLDSLGVQFIWEDFSSVYYLGSRFLRDLVTKKEDFEGYTNPINKDFYDLELKYSGGGFGVQQAYIIQK